MKVIGFPLVSSMSSLFFTIGFPSLCLSWNNLYFCACVIEDEVWVMVLKRGIQSPSHATNILPLSSSRVNPKSCPDLSHYPHDSPLMMTRHFLLVSLDSPYEKNCMLCLVLLRGLSLFCLWMDLTVGKLFGPIGRVRKGLNWRGV